MKFVSKIATFVAFVSVSIVTFGKNHGTPQIPPVQSLEGAVHAHAEHDSCVVHSESEVYFVSCGGLF